MEENKEIKIDLDQALDVLLGNYQLMQFIKQSNNRISSAIINILHNVCVITPEDAHVIAQPIRAYAEKIKKNLKQPAILQQTIEVLDGIIAFQCTKDEQDENAIYDFSLLLANASSQEYAVNCDVSKETKVIIETLESLLKQSIDKLTVIINRRKKY